MKSRNAACLVTKGRVPRSILRKHSTGQVGGRRVRLPVAQELGETSLMFLVHPTLTSEEIQKTCDVIGSVFERACRQ